MTPAQQYKEAFETLYSLCEENGWGDPFSYARSREIHMAVTLGHQVADDYSGADAIDEEGEAEYKSTINKNINGTYNGVSVQPTWEEQKRYLIEDKIGKYQNHYIARYDGGKIVELYRLTGETVLKILMPKFEKDWNRKISGNYKDPRLSATLTKGEIHKNGTKVL